MELFFSTNIKNNMIVLDKVESNHCMNVLRYSIGDSISITDGSGKLYKGVIQEKIKKECHIKINKVIKNSNKKKYYIHIAISTIKNHDRLEWFVEKAIEIGIDEISFLECERTIRTHVRLERLKNISISAMKQSKNLSLPKINSITKFEKFISNLNSDNNFICHCQNKLDTNIFSFKNKFSISNSSCILIGPEGDFSSKEINLAIQNKIHPITLGNSRLRTETAGVIACHLLNLVNSHQL